jgi:DNA processing protein
VSDPFVSEKESRNCAIGVALTCASRARKVEFITRLVEGASLESLSDHLSVSERRAGEVAVEEGLSRGFEVISYLSSRYPAPLRAISMPPAALFVRAREAGFTFPSKMVSVVGTRAASVEMCERTSRLSEHLSRSQVCVVSGLALGIDGAAHRGALAAPGPCSTIAVVAHGLERTYPPSHTSLADSIVENGGAIVSEYPPGTEPFKHHFLERNRIVAGLALGVVVVQAGERSGSLVTARFAAEYGRDVFVLEVDGDDARCRGGANLIDEGAIPISGAREVLQEYGLHPVESAGRDGERWQTMTVEEYLQMTGFSAAQMLRFEMEGRVVRLPGNRLSVMLD